VQRTSADTIADGLATRNCHELTFPALCEGLTDFITVSEEEIADAVRWMLRYTHNLAEPAGAAGLAGLRRLAPALAGKRVAIILSGANIDGAHCRAKVASGQFDWVLSRIEQDESYAG
jgi:threonine dehydratase